MIPRYPDLRVKLIGEDGNGFGILAKVQRVIRQKYGDEEAQKFLDEASSGDYNHLLQTVMEWVDVE